MHWRPFHTAPKTPRKHDMGPRILAHGDNGVTIVFWRYADHPKVPGWWVDMLVIPAVPKGLTHWMPLPEAPGPEPIPGPGLLL